MMRRGVVQLDGVQVGLIEETEAGSRFQYDSAWLESPGAVPISQRLPLRTSPHQWNGGLHPFFENLLPEGWLLELAMAKLKISEHDAFGLLLSTCRDCAGAVEVYPQ